MQDLLKILHFLGLAVGIGGGVANGVMMMRMAKAPDAARPVMAGLSRTIGQLSFIALIVLWITGLWMVGGRGGLSALPWPFWIKLLAVLALTAVAVRLQWNGIRAKRTGTPPPPAEMRMLGIAANLSAILVVIFAVLAFG